KVARERLRRFRRAHRGGGIGFELAHAAGPAEEAARRGERASLALLAEALRGERSEEAPQVRDLDLVELDRPRIARAGPGEERDEPVEIASVGAHRVGREPALLLEMAEKAFDEGAHQKLRSVRARSGSSDRRARTRSDRDRVERDALGPERELLRGAPCVA